ncbi:MAG: DUF3786 domain-containing protein [Candidatus Omnitrophica bacterium]|nr:DUF3786 domain-containing protein [Candidatus Omnitrophota bacterium]
MDDALKIATQKFRNLKPAQGPIKIKYLTKLYLVSPDTAEVTYFAPCEGQVSKREKIIILHYLTNLSPGEGEAEVPVEWIDFRDVPSGNMYNSVFEDRIYQPFLARFGKNPSLFIKAAKACGGEQVDFGDIAFKFVVLPGIPINFILHKGDEEFPPACKVLFDSSVSQYLHTEDIAIVCEDMVMELISL